jgi:hypothetical protein
VTLTSSAGGGRKLTLNVPQGNVTSQLEKRYKTPQIAYASRLAPMRRKDTLGEIDADEYDSDELPFRR